jgi:hypothetical protein
MRVGAYARERLRSGFEAPPEALPADLVNLLLTQVRLSEAEVAAMSKKKPSPECSATGRRADKDHTTVRAASGSGGRPMAA